MAELTVNELAAKPLKVTLLAPVRLVPVIVTIVPLGPLMGVKLVIVGTVTVKLLVLVAVPFAVVTATRPVAALAGTVAVMLVDELTVKLVAATPLKFTLVAPVKLVPVIVTIVPLGPLMGVKLVMVGSCASTRTSSTTQRSLLPSTRVMRKRNWLLPGIPDTCTVL